MDWHNIDLSSPSESDSYLIDPLTFDTLLLEIGCNIRDINARTVAEQFEEDLQSRVAEAREIFAANLQNIVQYAQQQREED